ncbi:hypothetical protein LCGC14_0322610 [marine sediment metagenome]|uniref:Uncharacterized protein n=1 Tax=marine sediment metagenome TaxID=412755 RepID=A0A0F9U155_9ZZZZ
MPDNKQCPKCSAKMIQWDTGAVILTEPAKYPWNWRCGCGHSEKGGARTGQTEEQRFQAEWEQQQEATQ